MGARAQAIGPWRGGQTTKIHALSDVIGRPFALTLTPSSVSDVKAAPEPLNLLRGAGYTIADKGYDANALCRSRRQAETAPAISAAAI